MPRKTTLIINLTQYDYLSCNKKILSHDNKTPSIVLIKGINYPDAVLKLGEKKMLKGDALEDFKKLKSQFVRWS
jgi:hypothetical protein